jgi:hypothetical protein
MSVYWHRRQWGKARSAESSRLIVDVRQWLPLPDFCGRKSEDNDDGETEADDKPTRTRVRKPKVCWAATVLDLSSTNPLFIVSSFHIYKACTVSGIKEEQDIACQEQGSREIWGWRSALLLPHIVVLSVGVAWNLYSFAYVRYFFHLENLFQQSLELVTCSLYNLGLMVANPASVLFSLLVESTTIFYGPSRSNKRRRTRREENKYCKNLFLSNVLARPCRLSPMSVVNDGKDVPCTTICSHLDKCENLQAEVKTQWTSLADKWRHNTFDRHKLNCNLHATLSV